jgi:threonine dehydrogenase-like Zn-dependent dehydrogenase
MKAAVLQEPKSFIVVDKEIPSIRDDELLVKVKVCGICTSELDMWEGKAVGLEFPRFIGHEVSGIVEEVGKDVDDFRPGDRVALYVEGKGYAEYIAVQHTYAVKLHPDIKFEHALGEPIACSVNGVRKLDLDIQESVCIIGCGFMGLIMLQVFRASGAGLLIAVDTRDSMLSLAQKLGATHVFNPLHTDAVKEIKELTGNRGVDVGIEAAGIQQTIDLTTQVVRMEGKLEIFGFHQGEPRKIDWGYWNWMAFRIINGHTRSPHIYVEGMRIGLSLLTAGKLDMSPLVTHSFSLNEINHGFHTASIKDDSFVKGVITL